MTMKGRLHVTSVMCRGLCNTDAVTLDGWLYVGDSIVQVSRVHSSTNTNLLKASSRTREEVRAVPAKMHTDTCTAHNPHSPG